MEEGGIEVGTGDRWSYRAYHQKQAGMNMVPSFLLFIASRTPA